jgi:hypothetical protein
MGMTTHHLRAFFSSSVFLSFFLILIIFLGFGHLTAQVPAGKIIGTVTDEQGTPLPGVAVEGTSPNLVGRATAVTDPNGVYRLFAVTPGTYKIKFTLQGFKPLIRDGIVVTIEQTVKLNVSLEIGAIEEQVTVIGQTPLIDVKSTVKGMTMTKETFQLLPKGRNFDSLVTAIPGVANEPLLAGISVDGASGAENMFYIDGTDTTNLWSGQLDQTAVFEFVDEVQVKASGYQAEFGGSLGGVIQVITRQGGNRFHGDLIGFYSGSRLNGKERDTLRLGLYDINTAEYVNYQNLYGKDKVDRAEAGFNLGGPIFKDRLWFFASVLPVYNETQRHVKFDPSGTEGDFTRRDEYWNFHGKLTSQPFKFLRLSASFTNNFWKYKGVLPPQDGTGDPADVWSHYGWSFPNWSGAATADLTISNNALLSLRAGTFYTDYWTDQLVQPKEPRYYIGGMGLSIYPDIPAEYIRPRLWSNMPPEALWVSQREKTRKSSVNADFTYYLNLAGEHAWKLGVQWVRTAEDYAEGYIYPDYPNINFIWGRPLILFGEQFGSGKYGYYNVTGNEATGPLGDFFKVHSDCWAIYLQDSWTIKNRLTLNLGVRTESEYIPCYSSDPAIKNRKVIDFKFPDKLAPRVGFVYDVHGDSSLKIFGSFGYYFDVMKPYAAAAYSGWYKDKIAYYTLDTYEWDKIGKNGYYPGTLLTLVDWGAVDLSVFDPGLKPMSQREISLGVEKKLGENLSATVRLVQKHLRYTIEDVGVLGPGGGVPHYYLTNPGYGYSRPTTEGGLFDPTYPACPKAKREYWAVNFSLDKRFARNWLAGFSYTWSRLTGNYSGLNSSDEEYSPNVGRGSPNVEEAFDLWFVSFDKNLNPIQGLLATDRPHFFKFFGAYTFPFGLTLGTVVNAMSGTPITEMWFVNGYLYMPYNRANLGRTPFLWFANLYAEYSLRFGKTALSFNANVDNVFNVATATSIFHRSTLYNLPVAESDILAKNWDLESAGYVPDSRFKKAWGFYPPIAARLGVRFSF